MSQIKPPPPPLEAVLISRANPNGRIRRFEPKDKELVKFWSGFGQQAAFGGGSLLEWVQSADPGCRGYHRDAWGSFTLGAGF